MTINFDNKTTILGVRITVPEGTRRNLMKVKIPVHEGYRIVRMLDEAFIEQNHKWKNDGKYFILDGKELSPSERFFIEMQGNIDEAALDNLVFIKPAVNRDVGAETDKYWLESSLKNIRMFDDIYSEMAIDKVNIGVDIDIQKIFRLAIPPEIAERAISIKELLKSASSDFDRNKLFRSAYNYKYHHRVYPEYDPTNFMRLIRHLTSKETVREYIQIDNPYELGDVVQPDKYVDLIPQSITIRAITRLTLKNPTASGHLIFKKKAYAEKLKTEFQDKG